MEQEQRFFETSSKALSQLNKVKWIRRESTVDNTNQVNVYCSQDGISKDTSQGFLTYPNPKHGL